MIRYSRLRKHEECIIYLKDSHLKIITPMIAEFASDRSTWHNSNFIACLVSIVLNVNLSGIHPIIIPNYEFYFYGKLSIIYKLYFCLSLVLREFRINSDYLDDEGLTDVEINSNDDSMKKSFEKLMSF